MEYGIPVTLETPRGTLTFNDFAADDHYRLSAFELNKPLRKAVVGAPVTDGALVFPGYDEAAHPILEGQIKTADLTVRSTMIDRIRAWPRSLKGVEGILRWTPTGKATRRMLVELLEDVPVRGAPGSIIKTFQIALVAAEPTVYADAEQTADTSALTTDSGGDLSFPHSFPFSFGGASSGGTVSVTNGGEADSYPTIRVYGPITGASLRNATTGKRLVFTALVLGAGDYIEIDMRRERVLLNGDVAISYSRYVDPTLSEFWPLVPGANVVSLSGSGFSATTKARVVWRDAYE
jgi:hypothetical protein